MSELARLEFAGGNLSEALKLIEQAIVATESLRVNLKSQQLRASFLASVRQYYEFETEVLMRLQQQKPTEGFAAAALQVSEKSRARSLLELLREARVELRQGRRSVTDRTRKRVATVDRRQSRATDTSVEWKGQ